jgi:stage II sporulation protein D
MLWALALCPAPQAARHDPSSNAVVRISVLSLFKPRELTLQPVAGSTLMVEIDGQSRTINRAARITILPTAMGETVRKFQVQFAGDSKPLSITRLRAYSPEGAGAETSTELWLEVPGKLRRQYTGALEVCVLNAADVHGTKPALEAVLSMSLEVAVASVVQTESPPDAGIQALEAQAVAARSFLVARQTSHLGFDFCDTTHCQFLRSPPGPESLAAQATRATEGIVLTWHDDIRAQDRTLAAMYARSCGGRTHTLKEIGIDSPGYPYYAVRCAYCTRHPERWRREANGGASNEMDRLAFDRIHGWGALPSINTDALQTSSGGDKGSISGSGVGHGLGLCQLGAADMARHGASFTQILAHYYPNTRVAAIAHP